jgi:hypothetical protein
MFKRSEFKREVKPSPRRVLEFTAVLCSLAFFAVGATAKAHAATYYVDSVGGNDSSVSPTSSSTPWQTIAKVNSSSFNPGDQILFKRGDTWRETLAPPSSGSTSSSIIFGAYGSGGDPKPVITGADLKAIGDWTSQDGRTGGLAYDGLESGNTSYWTAVSGGITADASAARMGFYGALANITDTTTKELRKDLVSDRNITYTGFYFKLDAGLTMATNDSFRLTSMLNSAYATVWNLDVKYTGTNYQVALSEAVGVT